MADYANSYFVNAADSVTNGTQFLDIFTCYAPRINSTCFFFPTDYREVLSLILTLKNKGSKLLDIHPVIIKENKEIIADHSEQLYNLSLTEIMFPNALKIARVIPAHKSGPIDIMDNFRPISALPVFSNIFEKLTYKRMENFAVTHNILRTCQFGFRRGRSTTLAIAKLISHVVKAFHKKMYCASFFLDLRKAFDTISDAILLRKLDHYGYRGHSNAFMKSYFDNRKQYLNLDGHCSDLKSITAGVPQGSILGPFFFSLYINDLSMVVKETTVFFADDAAFVLCSPTLEGLFQKIRQLFLDIASYLNINKLVPNSSKSKLMVFASRPIPVLPDLILLVISLSGLKNLNM